MIPVNVIGGFLGAGKTTLVNHLLRSAGERYAVLVNDFGPINIDAALIAEQSDAVIALSDGCVCCTLGGDLGAALAVLAARRPAPDRIVIEASGVADPWQVAQLCLIEPGFALDAITVVADAGALLDQLADPLLGAMVRRQLAAVDLVVINKSDRADPARRAANAAAIAAIRPAAATIAATHGAIAPSWLGFAAIPHGVDARPHRDDHAYPFRSWVWRDPRPFDRDRLPTMLHRLPPSILRLKGWCRVGLAGDWRLLNYAGGQWTLAPSPPPRPEDAALVLIGGAALPPPSALAAHFAEALC
ncbi:MAG TPA: CobW family GTP-binding protein [Stellaceae bacterium]|nr:CobW family GTP-binding protein [Stellaceae bacterium]